MSAKMPPIITSDSTTTPPLQQRNNQRPTSLYATRPLNNSTSNLSKLGKPNVLLTSTTPSPGGTRIPVSSLMSPGMLRRSTSLRLRGDRSATITTNGHNHVPSFHNHSAYHLRHDADFGYIRSNNISDKIEGKGSALNAGPYSASRGTTERHQMVRTAPNTPAATRKLQGTSAKSPLKEAIQESPTRQRSLSLSLSTQTASPHTPPVSPDRGFDQDDEDDLDSLHSYSSIVSTASCDHAYVARNGTTFSGRKMKYVVHCSSHAGQTGDEYLTPTQRAQRQIRRLKALLQQAKLDLEQKDSDIFRLTKEVVELRLYKASLNSPEDKSNSTSSDAPVTVCENTPESPQPPGAGGTNAESHVIAVSLSDMHSSSCADSGHFDDLASSSSPCHRDKAVSTDTLDTYEDHEEERRKLIDYYENKLQELTRIHGDETQELKRQHNDRVEALLKTLSDVNERYCLLMPDYETARERIRDLEKQLDDVAQQLRESDEKQRKMYLQVYAENKDAIDGTLVATSGASTSAGPLSRVSVSDLLHQLQVTQVELENIKDVCQSADQYATSAQTLLSAKEAVSLWVLGARKAMYRRLVDARGSKGDLDPEVTLQFLKSAIYYFLTDKENHRGHLRAIESILGFSSQEILNINKATNTS